jgi:hypothetical protein
MLTSDVFDMILAGQPATGVGTHLNRLPVAERQTLLCTVCAMHDEIARNCVQTATEASKLLAAQCPFYVNGVATCLLLK